MQSITSAGVKDRLDRIITAVFYKIAVSVSAQAFLQARSQTHPNLHTWPCPVVENMNVANLLRNIFNRPTLR